MRRAQFYRVQLEINIDIRITLMPLLNKVIHFEKNIVKYIQFLFICIINVFINYIIHFY